MVVVCVWGRGGVCGAVHRAFVKGFGREPESFRLENRGTLRRVGPARRDGRHRTQLPLLALPRFRFLCAHCLPGVAVERGGPASEVRHGVVARLGRDVSLGAERRERDAVRGRVLQSWAHCGTAVCALTVRFTRGTDGARISEVDEGRVGLQGRHVTRVHSLVAGIGRRGVVGKCRVATVTVDVPRPREGGGFRAGRGDRRHDELRLSHGRVVARVVPVSTSHFEVVIDVNLEAVELTYGFVEGLLGVAEGAAASPGGGLGRDHQPQRGGVAGGDDATDGLGAARPRDV